MKKPAVLIPTLIAVLSLLVLSCGLLPGQSTLTMSPRRPVWAGLLPADKPPSATPQVAQTTYSSAATGVSISYPSGWVCEEYLHEVIFASSEDIIAGSELATGAAMMLSVRELDGQQTIQSLVETTLSELSFPEMVTSEPKPRTIGGQRGIFLTIQGTPEGAPFAMRGFLAGAGHAGRGYLFVAVAVADQWSEYGPVLEGMLESVCFDGIEPVYTNASLGLSLRYPEGWVYEGLEEQVIFGTSEEVISGAELETGAAMLVVGTELEEGLTLEAMFEIMISEMPFDGMESSDPQPRAIGGQDGIIIAFEGTPQGAALPMKGFLAATQHKDCGYLFLGISAVDEWCGHSPDLVAMLDSVQFMNE